ncbi:MAG TPA: bi-domain-containing oxidoreductase [Myxococcota bacterium]|nr:bi-domain-containing oxidoreductase [Myxococcota bacterium]
MRQIVQSARTGELELLEVPAPLPAEGQILVRNAFSVVSPGTEKYVLGFARKSLLGKARSRPDLLRQTLRKLGQEGPIPTIRTVLNRLDAPQALGYSSAGVVEAVGPGVTAFASGDRVACSGAGYASHAEIIVVPENLAASVPDGVSLEHAAFSTVGAIALQSLRVAQPTLGEFAVVIGLGLVGQLTVQLLVANGCRVLGIDLDGKRVEQALALGAAWGGSPRDDFAPWRGRWTAGEGADFAIVTAASETAAPLALAAELCRRKGRIVVVGTLPIELDRRAVYERELEIRMSTSSGPGRYDRTYEEDGFDYPLAYVRWTENRNLQAFLALIASGRIHPDRLDTEVIGFEDAVQVYDELAKGQQRTLAVVFRYSASPALGRSLQLAASAQVSPARMADGRLGVAFLGAGNYAKAVLLPLLAGRRDVRPVILVTASGASARRTAERFGFATCATDPKAALGDASVDLVFVTTRHDSHAELAIRALRAGKAVWLEKPVGLTAEQAKAVVDTARETGGFLAIGYNRRFSRHAIEVKRVFENRQGPLAIHYSVSVAPPPRESWTTDPAVGGGRIIGESCHFVDLFAFLIGAPPTSVFARALGRDLEVDDSLVAQFAFPDGSIATLEYLACASQELPKERFEISGDGKTVLCENFRTTRILGSGRRKIRTLNQDKGQAGAVSEILECVRSGAASPFRVEEIDAVFRATCAALVSARERRPVEIDS